MIRVYVEHQPKVELEEMVVQVCKRKRDNPRIPDDFFLTLRLMGEWR